MSPVVRRLSAAAATTFVLALGCLGLVFAPSGEAVAPPPSVAPTEEARLLTAGQADTFAFFNQSRATPGSGRGLFETDFFKPPPAPPPKPKPAPPATRELGLFYRGLAAFPDGASVAYLAVEKNTLTFGVGDVVADGWKLASFDSEQAVLAKDDRTVVLPFNRRSVLTVPAKP
jgi:hypothetical protein